MYPSSLRCVKHHCAESHFDITRGLLSSNRCHGNGPIAIASTSFIARAFGRDKAAVLTLHGRSEATRDIGNRTSRESAILCGLRSNDSEKPNEYANRFDASSSDELMISAFT
jgi:hypothetical protein